MYEEGDEFEDWGKYDKAEEAFRKADAEYTRLE